MTGPRLYFLAAIGLASSLCQCGDDIPAGTSESEGNSSQGSESVGATGIGPASTTAVEPTSSTDGDGGSSGSTSGADGCPHEEWVGDLTIRTGDDTEPLVGITEVTGSLYVNLEDATDLNFLGCLEVVREGVVVKGASGLTSLAGLERLEEVGWGLGVEFNDNLTSLDGLDSLRTLPYLGVQFSPALTSVGVPTLETIERLQIGQCGFGDGNDSLVEISGFDALVSVTDLIIEGNSSLESLAGLAEIAAVGASATRISITHNPSLPPDHAQEVADALGGIIELCGNQGETARCECTVPES